MLSQRARNSGIAVHLIRWQLGCLQRIRCKAALRFGDHTRMLAHACAECSVVLSCSVNDIYGAYSPRNRCASIFAVAWAFAACATPNSSLALLDFAHMLQIRSLNSSVTNAATGNGRSKSPHMLCVYASRARSARGGLRNACILDRVAVRCGPREHDQ